MADKPQQAGGGDAWDATQWHVVQKGDTLSKIAQHYYGNMRKWPVIYVANRKIIGGNPDLIRSGQRLYIPNLPDARIIAAMSVPGNFPVAWV